MRILVLNCGSSSVKYQLFDMADESAVAGGAIEKIGEAEPSLVHRWKGGRLLELVGARDHAEALSAIRRLLLDPSKGGGTSGIAAVGHRVVHGGEQFVRSTLITRDVEDAIEAYGFLAPLHNPPNLAGVRAAQEAFPSVPHVAVFDTAFHQTMPDYAYLYAIRYDLYEEDRIRKYGFHGTSHRYVAGRAAQILGKAPGAFTGITCHLGNGCSLTAVKEGRSVDTSMGLTPLEGVPMGTRSGDIDPAIIFHLAERRGMRIDEINRLLNRGSGLLGLSGVSNDLREIQKAVEGGNLRAEVAQAVYAYRVRKYIGAYLAVLGGADAVVFAGGVGENGADMRRRILDGMAGLGLVLDPERNRSCVGREGEISAEGSRIRLLVVPTNEELMIALDTREILELQVQGQKVQGYSPHLEP